MKKIKFENLQISSQVFYFIETITTEYRCDARIFLTVNIDGTAYITAGHGTNNVHGLQVEDLHKGAYITPYFAYKNITLYPNVDAALNAYNEWKTRVPALHKVLATQYNKELGAMAKQELFPSY